MGVLRDCLPDRLHFQTSVERLSLDGVSFQDVAAYFRTRTDCSLLESQGDHGALGEYSFLCFAPFGRLTVEGERCVLRVGEQAVVSTRNPFAVLDEVIAQYEADPATGADVPPFTGGLVGYFGYELARRLERLPQTAVDDTDVPVSYLCLYNFTIAEHRESGTLFLCHLSPPRDTIGRSKEEVLSELRRVPPGLAAQRREPVRRASRDVTVTPGLTKAQYLDAIRRIKEYIEAGDVYQVNMTQRFNANIAGADPWDLYRYLATTNPAPFAAFLNHDGHSIVSSSPERFVRVRGRSIETRPIKGTIRRGDTPEADLINRARLLGSPKDRAELAMIVDLLRNDLGRACTPGTIRVLAYPQIESYASVHHLVATIVGELEQGRSVIDVLRATFPGGSITGCPKIRAMEIIDELEPTVRGVYTGSIGYVGFDGSVDLNIAIRTVIVKNGLAYIHAGGGIVADSDGNDEYEESLLKAGRLLDAVRAVGAVVRQ